jgi:hypothetical protein
MPLPNNFAAVNETKNTDTSGNLNQYTYEQFLYLRTILFRYIYSFTSYGGKGYWNFAYSVNNTTVVPDLKRAVDLYNDNNKFTVENDGTVRFEDINQKYIVPYTDSVIQTINKYIVDNINSVVKSYILNNTNRNSYYSKLYLTETDITFFTTICNNIPYLFNNASLFLNSNVSAPITPIISLSENNILTATDLDLNLTELTKLKETIKTLRTSTNFTSSNGDEQPLQNTTYGNTRINTFFLNLYTALCQVVDILHGINVYVLAQQADAAKKTADAAKGTAETEKGTADAAKGTADAAKGTADAAKNEKTYSSLVKSLTSKNAAETAKNTAETAKNTAETANNTAETAKKTAETAKNAATAANSAYVSEVSLYNVTNINFLNAGTDYNQANFDYTTAYTDYQQANLDYTTAYTNYNTAENEYNAIVAIVNRQILNKYDGTGNDQNHTATSATSIKTNVDYIHNKTRELYQMSGSNVDVFKSQYIQTMILGAIMTIIMSAFLYFVFSNIYNEGLGSSGNGSSNMPVSNGLPRT